jgi:hypothetical protein
MGKANQKSRQQLDAEARRCEHRHEPFMTCNCAECRDMVDRCQGCGRKSTRVRTRTHERYCYKCGHVEKLDANNQRIGPLNALA